MSNQNKYVYNIDDSIYKERNKSDYEREYAESIKCLDNQKPLWDKNNFDRNTFNKLFMKKNKSSNIIDEEIEEVEPMQISNNNYTDFDTLEPDKSSFIGYEDFNDKLTHTQPIVITQEEIKNAKKTKQDEIKKLTSSEMNSLINKRNSEKLNFNNDPLTRNQLITKQNTHAPPAHAHAPAPSQNIHHMQQYRMNQSSNDEYNKNNEHEITKLHNIILQLKLQLQECKTKELEYINEIKKLKKINKKLDLKQNILNKK